MGERKFTQILVASLIPIGPHIFRAFWGILSVFLFKASVLSVFDFGIILALESVSSLFVPALLGSRVASATDLKAMIQALLFMYNISLILVWLCLKYHQKILLMMSLVLFGGFSCALTPLQRVLLKEKFREAPALAAGIFSATSNFAKIVSKLACPPIVVSCDACSWWKFMN